MKNKLVLALLTSLLAFSASSFAGGWSDYGKITSIYVGKSFVLFQHSEKANPDSCPSNGWYELDVSVATGDMAYSLLLSSNVTQENVRIHSSGCSSQGRAKLNVIQSEVIIP